MFKPGGIGLDWYNLTYLNPGGRFYRQFSADSFGSLLTRVSYRFSGIFGGSTAYSLMFFLLFALGTVGKHKAKLFGHDYQVLDIIVSGVICSGFESYQQNIKFMFAVHVQCSGRFLLFHY